MNDRIFSLLKDSFVQILLPGLGMTIPLTVISFALGLLIALVTALVQVVNVRGDKIIASVLPDDMIRPQMYLSIAYDETYGEVDRMNQETDPDIDAETESKAETETEKVTETEGGNPYEE